MGKIAIDTPLAEFTLRKYEAPGDLSLRQLTRKFCLSLGLLQPGDSRDVIVDVLMVLLEAKEALTSIEIERRTIDNREKHNVPILGVAPSNIRRQVFRLRDIFIVEKVKSTYRIKENITLSQLFDEHIEAYLLKSIVKRVKEYTKAMDKAYKLE